MSALDSPLAHVIELVRARFGLDYGGQRLPVLLECLAEMDGDLERATHSLVTSDRQRFADFVGRTTNTESYFFRHPDQFDAMRELLRRQWLAAPPTVYRAWCAGCSSGEEPLSVSAALDEVRGQTGAKTALSIVATDINPAALAKAQHATYTEWSFRGVTPEQRSRYFSREGAHFRPKRALLAPITFRRHNLLDGPAEPVPFDLVVCRNVLIYFDAVRFEQAINLLALSVAPGGLLVLGPVESAAAKLPDFDVLHPRGCVLYRKRNALAAAMAELWSEPTPPLPLPLPLPRPSAPGVPAFAPPAAPPALAGEPDAALLIARARGLADQGRLEEARALGEEVRRQHGDSPELHILFALVLLEDGRRDDALHELEQAIAAAPGQAMAHYLLGSILESGGARAQADVAYRLALAALADRAPEEPVPGAGGLTVRELLRSIAGALGTAVETPP